MRPITQLLSLSLACMAACGAAAAAPPAAALLDGVWVGARSDGQSTASMYVHAGRVVITDEELTAVASLKAAIAGPGFKASDALAVTLDLTIHSMSDRDGATLVPAKGAGPLVSLGMMLLGEAEGTLCLTRPGSDAGRPRLSPRRAPKAAKDTRCYAMRRVASIASRTPAAGPPGDADPDCMRECRHQNQMRAVSADVIDADCRRTCTREK